MNEPKIEKSTERRLIAVQVGVEWQEEYHYWLHAVSAVWEYPDGSKRIVRSGFQGFADAQKMAERWIKHRESKWVPQDGPLSGKRIRAKGGSNDEPFCCDGESWKTGEYWVVCDLGIPGGTLGTILDYNAERNDYHIKWDDGRKWGKDRPECQWSEAHDWLSEAQILEGAVIT